MRQWYKYSFKPGLRRRQEKLVMAIAWLLPIQLVYWAVIRAATQTHDSYPGEAKASDILKRLSVPALLLSLVITQPGCAWFKGSEIADGSDKFVVLAERELKNSMDAIDEIWRFDHENLAWMKSNFPQAHQVIQESRVQFWPYHDTAVAAVRVYKLSRTPADGQAVSDSLTRVRNLVSAARQALAQTQQPAPTTAPTPTP